MEEQANQNQPSHLLPRAKENDIPCTVDLLSTSGMQLALMVQPLALSHPSEEPTQVVDFGEGGPVRCSRCKGYINPFMKFVDQGRKYICNLCGFTDETTRDHHCNLGPDGRRRDADDRPELSRGTVEFVATKEYMVRDPLPAVYFFLIDVSMNAIQTGATAAACNAIQQVLSELPEGPRTFVGIATFDSKIHFYNLKRALQQPLMLITPEVQDVYRPLETDVIVQLSECRQHLELLLDNIPTMFQESKTPESAFGAAVKAAFLAMKRKGGKLLVFQSILCSVGVGAISSREAEGRANMSAGEKEAHKLLQPADETLKTMAIEFAEYQVCVDIFIITQAYVDMASISVIPRTTGGQVYCYYPFSALSDPPKLYNDLKSNIKRKNRSGDDGDLLKQNKKSKKVVSLSSFKKVENEKILDKKCIGTTILHKLEDSKVGLDKKMCDSSGIQGISVGLAGSTIYVPRRRRDFVGRSRFENGLVQKSPGESDSQEELVDNVPKENCEDSSAQDQLSKVEGNDLDKEIQETKSAAQLQLENGHSNQFPVKDDQLIVVKQRNSSSKKRKSSTLNKSLGKEAKSSSGHTSGRISKVSREDDEENLEANAARMLSSRFDPNCTQFPSNSVTPGSPSTSKPLTSGKNSVNSQSELLSSKCISDDIDDRMLRPRRKHGGKGKVRKRRHFYEILFSDVDSLWLLNKKIKVFWPLDESWYHGFVDGYDGDKNLHHVKYDDRDEEWINLQGERFKILLFPSEVPGKNQPKRRGSRSKSTLKMNGNDTSSKDEEKQKGKLEDDSCMESEPIITWLTRSRHRDKSFTVKAEQKQKKLEVMTANETVEMDGDVVRDAAEHYTDRFASSLASCGSPGSSRNELESSGFRNGSIFPIVYCRRRFHTAKRGIYKGSADNNVDILKRLHVLKTPDPDIEFLPIEDFGDLELYCPWNDTKRFKLSLSQQVVTLMYNFLMVDVNWLSRVVLLHHHGQLVTLWPRLSLEMIFLNNHDGLQYLIFEGCLMEVVQLISRILMVVDHSNKRGAQAADPDMRLPVFSIGLQVSCIQGLQRQLASQFYSFQEVKRSMWSYLEQNVMRHSLLVKQVSTSKCTHDNINVLHKVMQKRSRLGISSGLASKGSLSAKAYPTAACYKKQTTSPFAIPFTARPPTLLFSLHLNMIREMGHAADFLGSEGDFLTDGGCHMADCINERSEPSLKSKGQNDERIITSSRVQVSKDPHTSSLRQSMGSDSKILMSFSSSVVRHKHETRSNVPVNGISIQVPISDHCENGTPQSSNPALNIQGSISSPKATAPRSMWHRNKSSLNVHLSHGWSDSKGDFLHSNLANGPKKRRTQVSYSLPSGGFDSRNKDSLHKGLPNKRIRRSAADVSRGIQKDLESSFCDANLLVTLGDRGWRENGAQIVLEPFDNNEWTLAVKMSGTTKYSHRAHQFLQPGSVNRFTHAMMWKGGKDWTLEFPDRGQWSLFKEMHEECYNRNSRAALVRNIPIPGIRMIEKDNFDGTETEFIRSSSKYYRQTKTDVEMALDPLSVLYDMDSDDEHCLLRIRECSDAENSGSSEITEDMFEKAMDMFEKASFVKQHDHFTLSEIQELIAGVGSLKAMEALYDHWRTKRQRKGMPLIRHLQPPLWEKYQRELKDWELDVCKANTPNTCGSEKKQSPSEKPAMFAFCFKPRGLEVKYRGTKQRSQKKLSVYAQHSSALGDYDYNSSGRRSVGFASGDERFLYSNQNYEHFNDFPMHPVFPGTYSPRDRVMGCFSKDGNGYHRSHRDKLQRINGKRNTSERWDSGYSEWRCDTNGSQRLHVEELQNSTYINDYKLRDAAGAARRARTLAKLKRERAEKLRYKADLAIQKAAAALMCADAVKASSVDQSNTALERSSEG